MKARTWKSFFKQGIKNAFGNKTMSVASIVAIVAALCVLGVVMIIALNLNYLMDDLETKSEVTVFLEKDTSNVQIRDIKRNVEGWDGVRDVEFISKASALAKWKKDLEDKSYLLDGYEGEDNPLPHTLVVGIEKPEYVETVARKSEMLPNVMKVNYSKEVAATIEKIVRSVRLIGIGVVIILASIAAIIIHNTVRLTVYSRRREINIMKYIGATDWYIRWPFIIEGFTIGLTGSVIASGLIVLLYKHILNKITGPEMADEFFISIFKLLPLENVMNSIIIVFLFVGVFVGIIGSGVSIRKHLKV